MACRNSCTSDQLCLRKLETRPTPHTETRLTNMPAFRTQALSRDPGGDHVLPEGWHHFHPRRLRRNGR